MFIKTINLPIYETDIVVIIDNWHEANKKFKLELTNEDLDSSALTVDYTLQKSDELYLLYKSSDLDINTLIHEIFHATISILNHVGIKIKFNHQESCAYLGAYIGEEVFKIVEKSKRIK